MSVSLDKVVEAISKLGIVKDSLGKERGEEPSHRIIGLIVCLSLFAGEDEEYDEAVACAGEEIV